MLKPEPAILARILIEKICELYEEGELAGIAPDADLGYTCEAVFGFAPADVLGVHTHKTGAGDGLWFRLKDGRVISALREESDPDPALYDTVAN